MSQKDDEFLTRLRAAFQVEAQEHLDAIASGLLELEKTPHGARREEIVASAFREAHSLKGAARAVNFNQIEAICQSMESVFAAWKHGAIEPVPERFDPLHRALDLMGRMLPSSSSGAAALDTLDDISGLFAQLKELEALNAQAAAAPPAPRSEPEPKTAEPQVESAARATAHETLRISTAKLEALLRRAEELLALKLSGNQRPAELRGILEMLAACEQEWSKVAGTARSARQLFEGDSQQAGTEGRRQASEALRLLDFLDWNHSYINLVVNRLTSLLKSADQERRATASLVDGLLEDSKCLLMLPWATTFAMFPKLVRDLSRDQGKEIDLEIRGGEVEIDKRILEEMKDVLIHLLRNCVDHGIERPPERTARNKPPRGNILLAASQVEGNKVEIVISDDGIGIDPAEVVSAAVRQGMLSQDEARSLPEAEALALIFRPEVSTSAVVTELSGRGLGLAIAKEKVEKLGGRILVETGVQHGTTFRMFLPLTLATFRGILVQAAGQTFVLPTAHVERAVRIPVAGVGTIQNRPAFPLNGRVVPLVRLDDALGIPRKPDASDERFVQVLIIGAGEGRIGFAVDAVLQEQEVLVKRLSRPLVRVRNIAGATVLGSGKAVPVVNVADLLQSAVRLSTAPRAGEAHVPAQPKSILVVEDSITSRMLLRDILESAGYRVQTAVDGLDGFRLLKTETFDLVVSDIEMPRLNGFELTAKLRSDPHLAHLPVVLVTALESREHRERGVDVGANAYIVKSSFDQSNLLEVVERLA
ncbi:MAG TPA: hybrid sensor histidine kinase/response regulator [Phycisphaerae bacterium]|jgi:two-component system chemotaxis sensor kinase CheA